MLITAAVVIFLCLAASRISNKIGIPTLILFIGLGMFFGCEGPVGIQFENYEFANQICTFALIYIMFYGGFGINWKTAQPVALKAGLLSTFGVILTALITGVFCHYVLKIPLLDSFLLGSVMGSTDAAAVFYILKAKKLNLKNGLASILEIESGSNDPIANILTIMLLMIREGSDVDHLLLLFLMQFIIAILVGGTLGTLAGRSLKWINPNNTGLNMIYVFAIALFSYAASDALGGNGYLSVYITGIILGNMKIPEKIALVHFFDGITNLFQMLVFFLLGLLCVPSTVLKYTVPALLVMLFLTFVARPLSVMALMTPFKMPFKDQMLISWAGLRGASGIVFAIIVTVSHVYPGDRIFNIVFCVAMLSILIQGMLLPKVARKLELIDDTSPVSKTFNDYRQEEDVRLVNILITEAHPWVGLKISEIQFKHPALVVFIKRKDEVIIPRGDTVIEAYDNIVLSSEQHEESADLKIEEILIEKNNTWIGKSIAECNIPKDVIIIMVKRREGNIIPNGSTMIRLNDILLTCGVNKVSG